MILCHSLSPFLTSMKFDHINTWLFDLDGTLIDTKTCLLDVKRETIRQVGGTPPEDDQDILNGFGRGLEHTLHPWIPEGKIEEAETIHMRIYQEYMAERMKLFDGVVDILQLLKDQRKKMVVVTGCRTSQTESLFSRFGLGQFFPVAISSDTIPFRKPAPQPVLEAVKRVEGSLDSAVFIGDSEHDITAGRLAGVKTIGVLGGSSTEERLRAAEPDVVLERISDLFEIFKS